MSEPEPASPDRPDDAVSDTAAAETAIDAIDETASPDKDQWSTPPAQPLRTLLSFCALAAAGALYGYVVLNFWSSPWLGIHQRIPYPAYAMLAAAMVAAMTGFRMGLSIWSPHAKLAIAALCFLASVAIGISGGHFVSYTIRGTRNPPFTLKVGLGERFPDFALTDQNGSVHRASEMRSNTATIVMVYRGDFCPFARFELEELTRRAQDFRRAGLAVIAVSTDPAERSKRLAAFLHTDIPLLDDSHESILKPLGLIQSHRNGQPDNAIPAFFIIDRNGVVRWIFTSPFYREQPAPDALLKAARQVLQP